MNNLTTLALLALTADPANCRAVWNGKTVAGGGRLDQLAHVCAERSRRSPMIRMAILQRHLTRGVRLICNVTTLIGLSDVVIHIGHLRH
jgi:hypothetical protein